MEKVETSSFRRWLRKLKDETSRARIVARVNRLAEGLPGDIKPVGQGVSELRIHIGPGYRVYYHQQGDVLVILLCGGDKSTQGKDIAKARELLQLWKEQ